MKKILLLGSCLVLSLLARSANAALNYWDPEGVYVYTQTTSASLGYSGSLSQTWENKNWSSTSTGTVNAINFTEGVAAVFSTGSGKNTPAFTITMNANHTVAGFFDGSLNPNSSTVTIKGTGTITLQPGNLNGFATDNSSDGALGFITFNVPLAGGATAGIAAEDTSQVFLNATNTYSGGTYLGYTNYNLINSSKALDGAMIVNFSNSASFGTGPIYFLYCQGGALVAEVTSPLTIPNPFIVYQEPIRNDGVTLNTAFANIVGNPAGVTFSGPWTLSGGGGGTGAPGYTTTAALPSYAPLAIGSGGAPNNLVTISGAMTGTNNFYKYGVGILALSGANALTGNLAISNGTLAITGAGTLNGSLYTGNISNIAPVPSGIAALNFASSTSQTWSGVMSGSGSFTNIGPGILTLTGVNTLAGNVVIQSGTLALGAGGSFNLLPTLAIDAGGTLDVTAVDPYVLPPSYGTALYANGTGTTLGSTAAAIKDTAANANISVGYENLYLTIAPTNPDGDTTHPALYMPSGTVSTGTNNVFVTLNSLYNTLGNGTYALIQAGSGNLIDGGFDSVSFTGNLAPGAGTALSFSGGTMYMVVSGGAFPVPTFSVGSQSITYGTATVSLGGQMSAPGPVYPAMSDANLSVNFNGTNYPVTFTDAFGHFTLTVNVAHLSVVGSPYPVSYIYNGDLATLSSVTYTPSVTVTPAPLTVTATGINKIYDGTTAATVSLSVTTSNSDVITPSYSSATFANIGPATGIAVSVSGISLSGVNVSDYFLVNTTTATAANISLAGSQTWNGADFGTSPNWGDGGNWVSTAAPDVSGDALDFGGTVGLTPVMTSNYLVFSLTFDSTAGAFTLTNSGGTKLTVLGVTNNSASAQNISMPLAIGPTGSSPWSILGGSSITVISNVSDSGGGLTLSGGGTLNLMGSNNPITGPLTNLNGTLEITGNAKLNNGTYSAAISNNGTFIYGTSSNGTLNGVISGTGSLNDAGPGTLNVNGINTYSGSTTIGGGVYSITNDAAFGAVPASPAVNIIFNGNGCLKNNNVIFTINANRTITSASGAAVLFDAGYGTFGQPSTTHPITVAGQITGPGPLYIDMDGSPVVLMNPANNFAGGVVVGTNLNGFYSSGTGAWLQCGAPGVIPSGAGYGGVAINAAWKGFLDLNGYNQTINGLIGTGTVTNSIASAILSVGANNTISSFAGVIKSATGALGLTVVSGGSLTLTGTNTQTLATTISSGATLALATNGAISNTASLSIAAGGTFDVSALTSPTFSLSSSTTLSASGTGTALGSTAAAIKGATTVNLGSQAISLTFTPTAANGDSTHPALSISQGALTLNGNTIAVNNVGPQLGVGVYTLIQTGSAITGVPATNANVTGNGIVAGQPASISVSGGNVILTVGNTTPPTPTITSVTLNGTTLTITATNGAINGPYVLLESTNVGLPLTNWIPVLSNSFNPSGNVTIITTVTNAQEFFSIQQP